MSVAAVGRSPRTSCGLGVYNVGINQSSPRARAVARARLLRHHRLQVALLCAVTTASATAQAFPDEAPFLSSRLPLRDGVALPGSRLPDPVDRAAQPQVHRIVVSVERDDIPADGQTPAKLSIRVLGADGTLTGFGGGMATKAWLLRHECAMGAGSGAPTPQGAD